MTKVVLSGTPFDGSYDLEPGFTMAELHTIKRISGVRGGELDEAFVSGDTDLVVAFALIALQRAGKHPDEQALWNTEAGGITLDFSDDEPEADDVPPTDAAE